MLAAILLGLLFGGALSVEAQDAERITESFEREGFTLRSDELEYEETRGLDPIDAEDLSHIRMVQARERFGFAFEAAQPFLFLGEMLWQDLDRHLAFEACVPGPIDLAHGPGTEGAEDLVEGEELAGIEAHGEGV